MASKKMKRAAMDVIGADLAKRATRQVDQLTEALSKARLSFTVVEAAASARGMTATVVVPIADGQSAAIRVLGADLQLWLYQRGHELAFYRGALQSVRDVVEICASWKRRARKGEAL